jgi:hypothetical protein
MKEQLVADERRDAELGYLPERRSGLPVVRINGMSFVLSSVRITRPDSVVPFCFSWLLTMAEPAEVGLPVTQIS